MKRTHHNLIVWQEAITLVKEVYCITKSFPKEETFGLTSQIRRAAISVPCNIAEGAARTSNKEMLQFLSIARGSLSELETQIIISRELGYLKEDTELKNKIDTIFSLLGGLINSIRKKA